MIKESLIRYWMNWKKFRKMIELKPKEEGGINATRLGICASEDL